jgi:hypothetical protein
MSNDQPQPPALALDLRLERRRQAAAVTGAQPVEPPAPVAPRRREVPDALGHQQPLDAADVLDTLIDQPLALTAAPAAVLVLDARHPDHAAHLRLAALPGDQRAQQDAQVDPGRLGPARPAVDRQARRVDHLVLDAAGAQQPVQPEAVVAGLVAADHGGRSAELLFRPPPRACDQLQQRPAVAARDAVPADLVGHRRVDADQPARLAQF